MDACNEGDFSKVRKLLDEGRVSVHDTTEEGESLLSLACSAGYYELAQVSLKKVSKKKTEKTCQITTSHFKVEIFLEQREVAFLSTSKICGHLNFSTEIQIFANLIQIFANFAGW